MLNSHSLNSIGIIAGSGSFWGAVQIIDILIFVIIGGCHLVAERFLNEDETGPKNTLLLSVNMLVQVDGKERTPPEYSGTSI